MASSSDCLIVITPSTIAVASVQRGRVAAINETRRSNSDLVQAVETALDFAGGKISNVWLLATDIWSQPIAIQAEIARRVPGNQMAQFVCFEVEPLSGISPRQGLAGVVEMPKRGGGDPTFWVTEMDRTIFEQIEGLVSSRGARLRAGLHPAGAPQSLLAPTAPAWQRLEVWPDSIVCIAHQGSGQVGRHIMPRDVVGDEWLQTAQAWFADRPRSQQYEFLNATDDPTISASAESLRWPQVFLHDQTALASWLAAWAAALPKLSGVPHVLPSRKPMAQRTKQMIAACAAAVALLGCAGFYQVQGMLNQRMTADLQAKTLELTEPAKRAQAAQAAIKKLETELASVKDRETKLHTALESFRDATQSQRDRVPELLTALAETCGEDILLTAIQSDDRKIEIFGKCLDVSRPNDVARTLASRLAPLGLVVTLPDQATDFSAVQGAPKIFKLTITDAKKN